MNFQAGSRLACALLVMVGSAQAQNAPTSATIDASAMKLIMPEHFRVISTLEPIRRVKLIAPVDGVVRSIEAGLGTAVQANAEVAQLDRERAGARLKIADAERRELEAQLAAESKRADARVMAVRTELFESETRLASAKDSEGEEPKAQFQLAQARLQLAQTRLKAAQEEQTVAREIARARAEAAQARYDLIMLELADLTLRAPFAGTIVDAPISSGQFVLKGTVVAELADLSALKALVPVDRRAATVGGELKVWVEDQERTAKVKAIVPLPPTDEYKALRELASPLAAAWVQLDNADAKLEPGLRVRGPGPPVEAVATVAKRALQTADAKATDARVQVIRNEYVVNVPVKVLGEIGPERVQITGALRPSDALIISTSSPLQPGTLVRFGAAAPAVEGTTPNPNHEGAPAALSAPGQPALAPAAPKPRSPRPAPPIQSGGGEPF